MPTPPSRSLLEARLIGTAVAIAALPCFAAYASANEAVAPAYTLPAEIDRAVERFTGAAPGEMGGALRPADPRLRLAACGQPLAVDWYGTTRNSVSVSCAGPSGWRIFVTTSAPAQAARAQRVVSRGDPMTVIVRGRGFTVQQSGEAMEGGAIGEWIAIRTSGGSGSRSNRRAEPIRARIERPGLAVIQ